MKKRTKKKADSPVWCILHALYLLRYWIACAITIYAVIWIGFSWLAGINGTY